MYFSYQFDEISEFERESLKQQFLEELNHLEEVQAVLEEAFEDIKFSKKLYYQRQQAKKIKNCLKSRIAQIELDQQLKMVTVSFSDLKKIYKALKKRRISRIDPRKILSHLSLLEEKMNDEIQREKCGINHGFKSFPISVTEMDILLETIAI